MAEGGGWRRRGHADKAVSFAAGRLSRGGGSDLAQAGQSEGTPYALVYHALKGGHAGPF